MSADFEWVLEDCLKRMRSGQSSEDCLAAYPEQAEGLRPLLVVAGHIGVAPVPQPRPQAIQTGRERMLAAAGSNSAKNSSTQPVSFGAFSRYTVRIFTIMKTLLFGKETHGMKFALRLAIEFVAVMMIGGLMTVNASASSLPGDPLYGVKRTWEEVRLTLTLNDPARQELQDQIRQLRLDEVREMIQKGRPGMVEFEGNLESIAAEEWTVSGIRVHMLADTLVGGDPEIGQMVHVTARVQNNGTLTAVQVGLPNHHMQPTRDHTPMPTPAPSGTPWPTHMPGPTDVPDHTPRPDDDDHDGSPQINRPGDDRHNDDRRQHDNDHNGDCCH